MLNVEQQKVVDKFLERKNIYITGPAGTGKSYVLRHIIDLAMRGQLNIGVTASTGLAACHIQGRTLHSFLGIGLGTKPVDQLVQKIKVNKQILKRLKKLQVLVIDEVSMIDADLLDKVSEFLRVIREEHEKPFGGVQLILCGDFCQLPPVKGLYCFESKAWKDANVHICSLTVLVRQKDDIKLANVLGEVRWGQCSKDTLNLLKSMCDTVFPEFIRPTILYSKNVDVDDINQKELQSLKDKKDSHTITYNTQYGAHPSTKLWATSLRIPESIECCEGAQIIVTSNINNQSAMIVNGSRGVITAIFSDHVSVKLVNGLVVDIGFIKMEHEDITECNVSFMPLKLAYAITIHKSQGMTLDCVEMDLGDSVFEYGQAYTALSRARTLDSIRISSVRAKSFKTHPRVLDFYKNIACD